MFDQMRIDARLAATDDEAGQPAIGVAGNTLQIVRELEVPGVAPRLQVVRYRIAGGRVVRYASPPIDDANRLRNMLKDSSVEGWSWVALMGGVGAIDAKLYVPRVGWTTNLQTANDALAQNNDALKVPQIGNAPPARAVTGLQVSIGATSLRVPVTRIFLVGNDDARAPSPLIIGCPCRRSRTGTRPPERRGDHHRAAGRRAVGDPRLGDAVAPAGADPPDREPARDRAGAVGRARRARLDG